VNRSLVTLVLAVASQTAVSVINFGLPALSHQLQERLGVGVAGFGTIYAMVGLGATLVLIPAGMLVDRLGSRTVLLAGAALTATGDPAAAATAAPVAFGAALFVAGMGSAAAPVAGMTALMRAFPPERRGVVLGWRQLAVPLGGMVGAVMLPALAHAGGVSLALVVSAALVVASSAAFAVVVGNERADARPIGLGGVLHIHGMRRLLAVGALYGAALGGVLTYIVPAARDAGLGASGAGAVFLALNLAAAVSRITWGRAADRRGGSRRVTTLVQTGALSAAAALLVPLGMEAGVAAAVAAAVVLSFGVFGFNAVLYLAAGEWAGPERAGRAVAVASTVVFGSSSLVSPLVGVAIGGVGFIAVWLTAATLSGAGSLIAWRLLRDRRTARQAGVPIPDAGAGSVGSLQRSSAA
jgi:MFS family permease